jgi:hypothetical protein
MKYEKLKFGREKRRTANSALRLQSIVALTFFLLQTCTFHLAFGNQSVEDSPTGFIPTISVDLALLVDEAIESDIPDQEEWTPWASPLSAPTVEAASLPSGLVVGGTYFVSANGSDDSDGSETNPWKSIQFAVSRLQAGDALYILEGIYEESVDIQSSGTADSYITIEGIGNVIIDGSRLGTNASAFTTGGHDYIRFTNLTINQMGSTGIFVNGNSHHVEIDELNADGNRFAVRIENSFDVIVRNAYAINNGNAFRAFGASHGLLFEDIEAYNSQDDFGTVNPEYLNGDGFILESSVSNVTMRRITSANHWDSGFDVKANNVLIENVIVYGNKNNFKTWGENITIRSSLSRHAKRQARADGSTVEGNGITVVSGSTTAVNVTFVDNEDHDIAIYEDGDLTLVDSIVARKDGGGMVYESYGRFESDHVLWYEKVVMTEVIPVSATDVEVHPRFMDWDGGDFRLRDISIAINYGSATDDDLSESDMDGNDRRVGVKSDLGAFEFQGIPQFGFVGIEHGEPIGGVIFLGPDRDAFPKLRKATYYVDGRKKGTEKREPYILGGGGGFDTSELSDGAHVVRVVFEIGKRDKQTRWIILSVDQSASDPGPDPDPDPKPDPDPDPDPGSTLAGLSDGETVSGTIFVEPVIEDLPEVEKVRYFLNGHKAGETKKEPYTWGGSDGYDTARLSNGTHTLLVLIETVDGVIEILVVFHVQN